MGLLDWFRRSPPAPVAALPPAQKVDQADSCPVDLGSVDLYAFGAGTQLDRTFVEYIYERSKLAARIVDLMPEDMTRLPLAVDAGMIFDGKKISEAIDEKHGRMQAAHAMIYSRLYGGGALLAFVEDGRETWEPVDFRNITHIAGFAPMHRYELPVQSWDNRAGSVVAGLPNFNQPLTYYVQPLDGSAKMPNGRAVAGVWHRSRVIPWVNMPTLPRQRRYRYLGWSPGEIERIFEELVARAGGMQHIGNLLKSFGFDVFEMADLQTKLSSVKGLGAVQARLQHLSRSLQHTAGGVRVVAIDAGTPSKTAPEKLTPMARPVANVRDLSDAQRDYLQEVSDYPRSILYGWINAGLGNGEALGEKQAYYDLIGARQETRYIPQMRQMAELVCAAKDGPTGGIIPPHLRISCPSLWTAPEDVRAKVRLQNAQARKIDLESTAVSVAEVRTDKDLEDAYDLTDEAELLEGGEDAADVEVPPAELPKDLATEVEVQRAYRIGKKSIANMVAEGKVKAYRTGAGRRYSRAEVVAAMSG